MSNASAPRFVVVEGPIGVGKTSLSKRLAESLGGDTLLEGAEENPFLERFYQNPEQGTGTTESPARVPVPGVKQGTPFLAHKWNQHTGFCNGRFLYSKKIVEAGHDFL